MSNNCLITKLKGSVEGDLPVFGSLDVDISTDVFGVGVDEHFDSPASITCHNCFLTSRESAATSGLTYIETKYSEKSRCYVLDLDYSITNTMYRVVDSSKRAYITITNKYNCLSFSTRGGLKCNIDNIAPIMPKLLNLDISSNYEVYGTLSAIKNLPLNALYTYGNNHFKFDIPIEEYLSTRVSNGFTNLRMNANTESTLMFYGNNYRVKNYGSFHWFEIVDGTKFSIRCSERSLYSTISTIICHGHTAAEIQAWENAGITVIQA